MDPQKGPAQLEAIRRWYNGYLFGGEVMYNPWSVLCYIADERLRPYWLMTGSDDLLRDLMIKRGYGLNHDMETLLRGESLERRIDENIVLRDVAHRADALWGFLLFSGYLKPLEVRLNEEGEMFATLTIPNREIGLVFKHVFNDCLADSLGSYDEVERLSSALLQGDGTVRALSRHQHTAIVKHEAWSIAPILGEDAEMGSCFRADPWGGCR